MCMCNYFGLCYIIFSLDSHQSIFFTLAEQITVYAHRFSITTTTTKIYKNENELENRKNFRNQIANKYMRTVSGRRRINAAHLFPPIIYVLLHYVSVSQCCCSCSPITQCHDTSRKFIDTLNFPFSVLLVIFFFDERKSKQKPTISNRKLSW